VGLGYDELYDLTPRAFNNKLVGFNSYQEHKIQNDWERTRMVVHSTLSPHSKKKLKPKEILPFPWDKNTKIKLSSPEHIQDVKARHEEILKKLNK
jgi:hypothetical protein